MRPKKLSLISLTLLATLLIGAFGINSLFAPTEKKMYYFWYPYSYNLEQSPPEPWTAYIWAISGARVRDINTATIRIEGLYAPTSTKLILFSLIMIVTFHGYDVVQAILIKISHMSPGDYKVPIDITGLLKNGTPFRGTAYLYVTVPDAPPP
jgi:hypothetical protein